MATIKKLYFNTICYEDIEWGVGTIQQVRGGNLVTLNKVNRALAVGGQFADTIGDSHGLGIMFTSQKSAVEDIIVSTGTNAFSVDSFELVDGASLTIEDGAIYKVI